MDNFDHSKFRIFSHNNQFEIWKNNRWERKLTHPKGTNSIDILPVEPIQTPGHLIIIINMSRRIHLVF